VTKILKNLRNENTNLGDFLHKFGQKNAKALKQAEIDGEKRLPQNFEISGEKRSAFPRPPWPAVTSDLRTVDGRGGRAEPKLTYRKKQFARLEGG